MQNSGIGIHSDGTGTLSPIDCNDVPTCEFCSSDLCDNVLIFQIK